MHLRGRTENAKRHTLPEKGRKKSSQTYVLVKSGSHWLIRSSKVHAAAVVADTKI
jgi:hypothetical protein